LHTVIRISPLRGFSKKDLLISEPFWKKLQPNPCGFKKKKYLCTHTHMEKIEKNITFLSQFYPSDLVVSSNLLERERERERENAIIHI